MATRSPLLGKALAAMSAGCFAMAGYSLYQIGDVTREMAYRKSQLERDAVVLDEAASKDLPWKDAEGA